MPGNVRCTMRGCEAAYNIASDGIWFDAENAAIRILDNVSHHNDGCGIFFEINPGGGFVRFANNVEIRVGQELGADREAIFEAQIRYTVTPSRGASTPWRTW